MFFSVYSVCCFREWTIDCLRTAIPGVSHTSTPNHGELIVFRWAPYGHVAVISSVSGNTVYVVEQNSSPSGTNAYTTEHMLSL